MAMAITAQADRKTKWLPIGARVMVGWGVFNLILAVIVPITSLAIDPRLFTFGIDDARFVGMTWEQVTIDGPQMGEWMVLMMVAMCAFHFGYSVLTISVARSAYRSGEAWAWRALALSSAGAFAYNAFITGWYATRGLPGTFTASGVFPSGVSVGLPTLAVWTVVLFVGLWLPRREVGQEVSGQRDQERG